MANIHSNKPILMARNGQIKVLPLYMEPPITTGGPTDIVMGGCSPLVVSIGGVTEFCYFPSDIHSITTYGDALIAVTASGLLCVDYKVPPYGVVTGGRANTTTKLAGVTEFCYFPSDIHTINTGGDAHLVVSQSGILCIDYKVPPHGVILGGQANITTTLNGITEYCYFPTCGVTMGGEAGVDVTLGDKARGGKGTPMFRRERQAQATHYYVTAEAFFDNTLQVGGEASVLFTPARYAFIKSLPRMPIDWLAKQDSEFKVLYKELQKRGPANTFSYVAEPSNMKFGGEAEEDYFDFTNFIIMHDDDVIIADILSTDGNPFITTTFSQDLARRKRDDDDIIEILELL